MSSHARPGPTPVMPPTAPAGKPAGLDELLGALDQAAREANRLLGASAAKADAAVQRALPANARRRKGSKPKRTQPAWTPVSVAVLTGVLVTGLQALSREAIWQAWALPPVKYWYGYVPHELLRRLVAVTGVQPLLASGPLVYPVAAVALALLLSRAAGLGKAPMAVIFRLAGFAWDRNAFCRGWLITGSTGSGKCLGKGTPVLMYDGSVKSVEDVQPGDLLMGPDSQPRTVLSTARGRGQLFKIIPRKGEPWVCNDVHVMTLKHTAPGLRRFRKASSRQYVFRSPLEAYRETVFSLKAAGKGPTEISRTAARLSEGAVAFHPTTIIHYLKDRLRTPQPKVVSRADRQTRFRSGIYQAFGIDLSRATKAVREEFSWQAQDHIVDVPLRDFLERTPERVRNSWGVSQYWKLFRVPIDFPESVEAYQFDEDWFYFVGLWLGDGDWRDSRISTKDAEIRKFLESFAAANGFKTSVYTDPRSGLWQVRVSRPLIRGPRGYLRNPEHPYHKILNRCLDSDNRKIIPRFLKTASRRKRLSLLAGLVDTDGYADGRCISYVSISQPLAEDVAFVARSLV